MAKVRGQAMFILQVGALLNGGLLVVAAYQMPE